MVVLDAGSQVSGSLFAAFLWFGLLIFTVSSSDALSVFAFVSQKTTPRHIGISFCFSFGLGMSSRAYALGKHRPNHSFKWWVASVEWDVNARLTGGGIVLLLRLSARYGSGGRVQAQS